MVCKVAQTGTTAAYPSFNLCILPVNSFFYCIVPPKRAGALHWQLLP
jgi:hypothetical protein